MRTQQSVWNSMIPNSYQWSHKLCATNIHIMNMKIVSVEFVITFVHKKTSFWAQTLKFYFVRHLFMTHTISEPYNDHTYQSYQRWFSLTRLENDYIPTKYLTPRNDFPEQWMTYWTGIGQCIMEPRNWIGVFQNSVIAPLRNSHLWPLSDSVTVFLNRPKYWTMVCGVKTWWFHSLSDIMQS